MARRHRRRCDHCAGVNPGHVARCPLCGRHLAYELPTKADIQEQCDEIIRLHPKGKTRPGVEHWEVPKVGQASDRMRRREKEDHRDD